VWVAVLAWLVLQAVQLVSEAASRQSIHPSTTNEGVHAIIIPKKNASKAVMTAPRQIGFPPGESFFWYAFVR